MPYDRLHLPVNSGTARHRPSARKKAKTFILAEDNFHLDISKVIGRISPTATARRAAITPEEKKGVEEAAVRKERATDMMREIEVSDRTHSEEQRIQEDQKVFDITHHTQNLRDSAMGVEQLLVATMAKVLCPILC